MLTMDMSLQYLIDQEMIDAGFLQYEKGEDAPVLETLASGSVPLVNSAAR